MMDTSGSMTKHKKFLARSFFFLLYHFIRKKYENTEIVFLSHSSEAKEVSEDDFFQRVSSGGTVISSVLEKFTEICDKRYHKDAWNIYAFHCSDGDNWPSDNQKCVDLSEKIANMCQLYGYIQTVNGLGNYWDGKSGIVEKYYKIKNPKFKIAQLEKKEDVEKYVEDKAEPLRSTLREIKGDIKDIKQAMVEVARWQGRQEILTKQK